MVHSLVGGVFVGEGLCLEDGRAWDCCCDHSVAQALSGVLMLVGLVVWDIGGTEGGPRDQENVVAFAVVWVHRQRLAAARRSQLLLSASPF